MAEQQIQTLRRHRPPGPACLGALVLAVIALCALLPAAAPAATIRVDSKADALTGDSACTLREAVIAANADAAVLGCPAGSGDDVILLAGGTYKLTIPPSGTAFDPTTGSLDIYDPQGQELAIGSFVGEVAIDASAIGDRAVTTRSPLIFNYLTISGGDSAASAEVTGSGGAIAALGGTPCRSATRFSWATAPPSPAAAIDAGGPLEISNSTLSGNTVDSPDAAAAAAPSTPPARRSSRARRSPTNDVQSDDDSAAGGAIRFSGGARPRRLDPRRQQRRRRRSRMPLARPGRDLRRLQRAGDQRCRLQPRAGRKRRDRPIPV